MQQSVCLTGMNKYWVFYEEKVKKQVLWLQSQRKSIGCSPGLRMRYFLMICLGLSRSSRKVFLSRKTTEATGCCFYLFILIFMRNNNYLWQHLILSVNEIYSSALQPLPFLRFAFCGVSASVSIPICFCGLTVNFTWCLETSSECGSRRRSASRTEQVLYQHVAWHVAWRRIHPNMLSC